MERIPRKKKKKIPVGDHCYTYKKGGIYKMCPFWGVSDKHHEQGNGYCSLMKKGDWNLHKETTVTDLKTGKIVPHEDIPFGLGLLWDQIKECGIREWKY